MQTIANHWANSKEEKQKPIEMNRMERRTSNQNLLEIRNKTEKNQIFLAFFF